MHRCPQEDSDGLVGVTPALGPAGRIRWRRLWEVIKDYDFQNTTVLTTSYHSLHAGSKKVDKMRPRLQRYAADSLFTCDALTVKRPPPKPRKKKPSSAPEGRGAGTAVGGSTSADAPDGVHGVAIGDVPSAGTACGGGSVACPPCDSDTDPDAISSSNGGSPRM